MPVLYYGEKAVLAHGAKSLANSEDTSKLKETHTIYGKVYNSLKPILVSGRGLTYKSEAV